MTDAANVGRGFVAAPGQAGRIKSLACVCFLVSADPTAGHPPTGAKNLESRTRGILGGPHLVDARSSLSESLRGGAVTPRTWRFQVVTIVAARLESLSSGKQVSPSYLMTKEVKRI
jgi:hypothetical protein